MPALAVTVFDCVFMGFSQPKLGNFTIPIGEIMHEKAQRRAEELATAKHIATHLEMLLEGKSKEDVKKSFGTLDDFSGNKELVKIGAINDSGEEEKVEIEEVEMNFEDE